MTCARDRVTPHICMTLLAIPSLAVVPGVEDSRVHQLEGFLMRVRLGAAITGVIFTTEVPQLREEHRGHSWLPGPPSITEKAWLAVPLPAPPHPALRLFPGHLGHHILSHEHHKRLERVVMP